MMEDMGQLEWLLFFYSIPATPVNNRVKIWRKLIKIGAVQLKGGVYILPYTEEYHEALQWMLAELPGLKGEGLLIKTDSIEPLQPKEIIALFNEQRDQEYQKIAKKIDEFTGRIRNLRIGGKDKKSTSLFRQYEKLQSDFQLVQQRDFFQSEMGRNLEMQIKALRKQLEELTAAEKGQKRSGSTELPNGRNIANFSGLVWLTRKRPFVDRMASAWLIRRFIDAQATFAFRDEAELMGLKDEQAVSYDVRNGDFTHIDDLCTFEVLLKSFGLAEKGLTYLAGIVHDIDIKDGKFAVPEAHVIEMIIKGIRNRALSDSETLEQGMAIFEALYLSITEKH
ncbi:MAG: chromate resistance protein [Desulfocapsaceae bacterium]|nr:chromate resistance protein [Desulfocapsaceae bacterium]